MSISFSDDSFEQALTSTTILPEDSGEVSLRPRYLNEYIGQEKAKDNLLNMIGHGVIGQDLLPNLYIYRLTMNGKSQTGLVCCTSVDEYINGTIKKHEKICEKVLDICALSDINNLIVYLDTVNSRVFILFCKPFAF